MNYLTPESIVVLYPKLTFKRKGILQYRGKDTLEAYDPEAEPAADVEGVGRNQDYVTKYKSRGFILYSRPGDLSRSCGAACPAMPRTISRDADKWALHLKIGDPSSSFRTDGSGFQDPPNPITPAASPSISGRQTGEASSSQQSYCSGSWASSYVTDLTTEFSDLQIETGHESENGHETRRETSVTTITTISTSRGLNCTRPPIPETQWAFEAPPLMNEITSRLRRRARGVCRNPYCPRSRMRVSTSNA
ncbi:hypothetical protein FPV67DRAFT_1671179 [Lyophyllum atratum]|nr:hypothetical protein FPV67DRAFT_1671179 [Lyophyllum atratum]